MTRNDHVRSILDKRRLEVITTAELSTDRTIREIGRLAFSDPRRIMHADGRIKMPHELDEETAAAIASFEVSFDGSIKYKFWDKNSAIDKAAKIQGLYEKDNAQRNPLEDVPRDVAKTIRDRLLELAGR